METLSVDSYSRGQPRGCGLAWREACAGRWKITHLKTSVSGCHARAEILLLVTSGMLTVLQPLCPGSVERATPGGDYENRFLVPQAPAAPPCSPFALAQKSLLRIGIRGLSNTGR